VGWDWDHLVRRPLTGQLYQPRTIDDECGAVGGMRTGRGDRSTPVPLCPPQIPHDLTWAMVRPLYEIKTKMSQPKFVTVRASAFLFPRGRHNFESGPGFGRKRSHPSRDIVPRYLPEGTEENYEDLSKDSRCIRLYERYRYTNPPSKTRSIVFYD
jgi:hypothetical protein